MIAATRVTRALLLVSATSFVYGYFFATLTPPLVGGMILLYILYEKSLFYQAIRTVEMSCERQVSEVLYAKESYDVFVTCTNTSPATLHMRLDDTLPKGVSFLLGESNTSLTWPGEQADVGYVVACEQRGTYRWGPALITVQDANRLFSTTISVDVPTERYVHDSRDHIKAAERIAKKTTSDGLPVSLLGKPDGDEYEGIREYMPGDRASIIDWKSASRLQSLVSKLLESEDVSSFSFFVDASSSMRTDYGGQSSISYAVLLSMQLSRILLLHDQSVGFASYDEHSTIEILSPKKGNRQYARILGALKSVPSSFAVEEGLDVPFASDSRNAKGFIAAISPFFTRVRTGIARQGRGGLADLLHLMKTDTFERRHVIIISDLMSGSDEMVRTLRAMRSESRGVTIIIPYLPWFAQDVETLSIDDAKRFYSSYMVRKRRLLSLGRIPGVTVIEGTPHDSIELVYKMIGRSR